MKLIEMEMMKHGPRGLVYVVAGIFVVCAIVYAFIAQHGSVGVSPYSTHPLSLALGQNAVMKQMPAGLPWYLNVQIVSAYSIVQSGRVSAYLVTYNSPYSLLDEEASDTEYCLGNGWTSAVQVLNNDASLVNVTCAKHSSANSSTILFEFSSQIIKSLSTSTENLKTPWRSSVMIKYTP